MKKAPQRMLGYSLFFFTTLFSGCLGFNPPKFDPAMVPNPPVFPNEKLSSNAKQIPTVSVSSPYELKIKVAWYTKKDIGIIFVPYTYDLFEITGMDIEHLFTYDIDEKTMLKVTDKNIREKIISAYNTSHVTWKDTTSGFTKFMNTAGEIIDILQDASDLTSGERRNRYGMYSSGRSEKDYTFEGYVKSRDKSQEQKVSLELSRKGGAISDCEFEIGESDSFWQTDYDCIISAGWFGNDDYIWYASAFLTNDGKFLVTSYAILDIKNEDLHTSIPVDPRASRPPVLQSINISPYLDKIAISYVDPPHFYIETHNYKFPMN